MNPPLPITGIGLVTPLGRTTADTWQALLNGRHVTDHASLARGGWTHLPRVSALAIEAARQAIGEAGWHACDPAAVVACTSKGPIEDWIPPAAGAQTSDNVEGGGLSTVDRYGFGMAGIGTAVADELRLGPGPRLTISAACAGGLQALVRAALLIRSGETDRVLVVGAEASVHPMFLASFDRLGVLPPPGQVCRPYDVDRQGFLMSEAAAAVCLEAGPPNGCVCLDRFGLAADASHLTGVDRDGVTLRRLLASVGDRPFDLVHGHGTGTEMNDAAEVAALTAGLPGGGAGATLFSHKAALGHSLGASGLLSVAINVLCHRHATVPPNVNTRWPMSTVMTLSMATERRPVRHSLACAAGFGGGVAVTTFVTP